jgi:uncharacterized protein (DUF433 family)
MQSAIIRDVNILGGGAGFSRDPRSVQNPDRISGGGDTLDQFLEQYPSVTRELAIAAIEEARSSLVSQLK